MTTFTVLTSTAICLSDKEVSEVADYLIEDRIVTAIKYVRELTNCSLYEAKWVIDEVRKQRHHIYCSKTYASKEAEEDSKL